MNKKLRLCIDCEHHQNKGMNHHRCISKPSVVDGAVREGWRGNCKLLREEGWLAARILNTCGKAGRWFEPKKKEPEE